MGGQVSSKESFADAARQTAAGEQRIQEGIERADAQERSKEKGGGDKKNEAMQAGARMYPVSFPSQHLDKPGTEADLQLAPMCDAPHYKGSDKLLNCVALITAGDSGIGRAVAVLYAREGAAAFVTYLNEDKDAAETKRLVEQEGRRCEVMAGDVADPKFCAAAVKAAIDAFGKLDILVNNAAFQEHASDIGDITEEHFNRTLKTNLYGYFNMAKAAVPHLQPRGAIVMTGSVTGIEGSGAALDYAMTKGGIHAFTRSLSSSSSNATSASIASRPARYGRRLIRRTGRPTRSPSSVSKPR